MLRTLAFPALLAFASCVAAAPIDTSFTYQGELRQNGSVAEGAFDFRLRLYTEASGGSEIGSANTLDDVVVANGVFSLELDFGQGLVDDVQPYLAVEVRDGASSGAYTALAPRQKITAAPNALYALGSGVSEMALSPASQNVLQVSPSGAPYATLGAALAAIGSSGPSNRWLIDIGPGVYEESGTLTVPAYVHVRGAGIHASLIRSSNSAGTPGASAATLVLLDRAELSALTIENAGTGTFGIGVLVQEGATRDTLIRDARILATGSGGIGRYGVYLNDAEPTVRGAWIRASGASGFGTAVNAAIGSVNVSGGFPRALIVDSVLLGAEDSDRLGDCTDPTGTGFGWQSTNSAPEFLGSYVCGGHRGVFAGVNGQVKFRDSVLSTSSTSGAFLFETTSSATAIVVGSQVLYAGNKHTGTGGLLCHDSVKANFSDASDGSTAALACN